MDIGTIGVRYARALLEYASEHKEDKIVYDEMQIIAGVYVHEPRLRNIIENPLLTSEQKTKILSIAAGGKICESTLHFIRFVVEKKRADMMQFIASSYITLYLASKNITRSRLVVPTAITDKFIAKIRALVEKLTKGNVDFAIENDDTIGGGFILEYGTYRIDATIGNQIRKIKNRLLSNAN